VKIVQIACVEYYDQIPSGKIFMKYINPGKRIEDRAFNVNKISDARLRYSPKFNDIADEFLQFISNAELLSHNNV